MKPQHYLAIAVRIFAMYLLIYAVQQSRMLVELLINGHVSDVAAPIGFTVVISVLPFLVSAGLWFFPLTVARLILTEEINQPIAPLQPRGLLSVLVSAIGVFFLYYAISDAVYWATALFISAVGTSNGTAIDLPQETSAYVLTTLIELTVSLLFIFKAQSLAAQLIKVAR